MRYLAISNAEIRDTGTAKGRGVFTTRPISAGAIVEICPVVMVPSDWDDMPPSVKHIVFDWGQLAGEAPTSCIALGWGSLYNHQNPANLTYAASSDMQAMVFSAVRNIAAGEELTVNYNGALGDVVSVKDDWFSDTGIVLIP